MNIKDVPPPQPFADIRLAGEEIRSRQETLECHYWRIEGRPRLILGCEDREAQTWIKDFLWRITEEIGETLEAKYVDGNGEKVSEECADGLHFVVGLSLISSTKVSYNMFPDVWKDWCEQNWGKNAQLDERVSSAVTHFVYTAGLLGNTLKMKPWKQTDVTTDVNRYAQILRQVIRAYLDFCRSLGHTPESLYDYYWRKSEVNLFRIRSMY